MGLTLSAENNFKTTIPRKHSGNKNLKKTFFSEVHRRAYMNHVTICNEWRKQGRPSDPCHPAKKAKTESQRYLQKVAQEDEALKAKELK